MRTVIGTLRLAQPGGTESYCLTVAHELERLGHEVALFADELGPFAEHATELGFNVVPGPNELPVDCDAVLANDAITAAALSERYPNARLVFCLHSTMFDVQLPPLDPDLIDAIVAPSERWAVYARGLALDVPIVRLTQPIDVLSFTPTAPPRSRPLRALLLSNYLEGARRDALVETWSSAGIECVHVGAENSVFDVRPAVAEADIVVAKSRAALEGMACGKAVYVYDMFGGDGWVTAQSYPALEADNFAGQATPRTIDRPALAIDVDQYDSDMGWINRELARTHHDARTHACQLVELFRGSGSVRRERTTVPTVSARSARAAWRFEARALNLQREAADRASQLGEVRLRLDQVTRQRDAAVMSAESWRERGLAAELQAQTVSRLIDTKRVRAGIALGRWLDRLRGRS